MRLLEREFPAYRFEASSAPMAGPHTIKVMTIGWERDNLYAIITIDVNEPFKAVRVNADGEPVPNLSVQARTDSHLVKVFGALLQAQLPQD